MSIVLQGWEPDQNGMVRDMRYGESEFSTYLPGVIINEGPLSQTLSSIVIVNVFQESRCISFR